MDSGSWLMAARGQVNTCDVNSDRVHNPVRVMDIERIYMITPLIKNITLSATDYTEIVLDVATQNLRSVLVQCRNAAVDVYLATSAAPTEYFTLMADSALIIDLESLSETGLFAKASSGTPVLEVVNIVKTL